MQSHDESVELNDRVFDIGANRGYGRAIRVTEDSIEVKFDTGPSVIYNYEGIQKNRSWTTLFWDRPFVLRPPKDESSWVKKQELLVGLLNFLKGYKEFL